MDIFCDETLQIPFRSGASVSFACLIISVHFLGYPSNIFFFELFY